MSKTTTTKTINPSAWTQTQLLDKLRNLKGTTFVTLVTRTEPGLRSLGGVGHKSVFKLSRVNGVLNFIYENSVNRQRRREGTTQDFVAEPRVWGQRISGTPLVAHKGKWYVEMKVEQALGHTYVWANGTELTTGEVKQLQRYLKKPSQPSTQGTAKEIVVRDYKLTNIHAITMDGTKSVIIPL